jgi:hypothetical protein
MIPRYGDLGARFPNLTSGQRRLPRLGRSKRPIDRHEGCDFLGVGPHSLRRANITWRQEVGGSSIEASNIAGHSTLRMTEEYTKIQLSRQDELTRRIQERLASVGEKQVAVVQ